MAPAVGALKTKQALVDSQAVPGKHNSTSSIRRSSAYVFAPSWMQSSSNNQPSSIKQWPALAFSSCDAAHREVMENDRHSIPWLSNDTDISSLSPHSSNSAPYPVHLRTGRPSQTHSSYATAFHKPSHFHQPSPQSSLSSTTSSTPPSPKEFEHEFPNLVHSVVEDEKRNIKSAWNDPTSIKQKLRSPPISATNTPDVALPSSHDMEIARLKVLVPKRQTAVKKTHLPNHSSTKNTSAVPVRSSSSKPSAKAPMSSTSTTNTPNEKIVKLSLPHKAPMANKATKSPSDTILAPYANPNDSNLPRDLLPQPLPAATQEVKERILHLIREWTGGAVRWETNCGLQDSNRKAKSSLIVGYNVAPSTNTSASSYSLLSVQGWQASLPEDPHRGLSSYVRPTEKPLDRMYCFDQPDATVMICSNTIDDRYSSHWPFQLSNV
ncbi:uncharacterized protein BYT42DRAFT_541908 [Radiomyces spectabilis]|uniref:uncharacterized protein n=1 Tax=Radiomyces spectabilis TaxID=64574 RepID=UPI00221E9DCA|nr:uncharacterized protein BYT42DRAFT_541908 [Radiomyces spectabilis]KAI8393688.1 hypothetical protein BYT42DRAFT_541908 [Radiomyces spectabilis]